VQNNLVYRVQGSSSDALPYTGEGSSRNSADKTRAQIASGSDVPPLLSSAAVWSPILPIEEIGREEAIQRRADHRVLEAG
jgi:hypothetical protein